MKKNIFIILSFPRSVRQSIKFGLKNWRKVENVDQRQVPSAYFVICGIKREAKTRKKQNISRPYRRSSFLCKSWSCGKIMDGHRSWRWWRGRGRGLRGRRSSGVLSVNHFTGLVICFFSFFETVGCL